MEIVLGILGILAFAAVACVYAILRTNYINNIGSEMIELVFARSDWYERQLKFDWDKTYSWRNVLSLTKWTKKDLFPEFKDILEEK